MSDNKGRVLYLGLDVTYYSDSGNPTPAKVVALDMETKTVDLIVFFRYTTSNIQNIPYSIHHGSGT
jgi:hypothetical protein